MNVGIDLGTTYSCVATFDKSKGEVVILNNQEGEKTTPSVTCIEKGKIYIGNEAKSMMASGDTNAVAFYKNMMGMDFKFYIDGKEYSAEDISSFYLKELKKDIETANKCKIDGAVITVPAYFDEKRRNATLKAGERAGFKVLKIINEPTSAIIAYGLTGKGKKTVMVYDLGGGTFDVTIAEINGTHVDVLTTNGDHTLGGKDWDTVIHDEIVNRFNSDYDVDISSLPEENAELMVQCEECKKKLTSMKQATIVARAEGYVGKYVYTREEFDEHTQSLLNQTTIIINKCFDELKKKRGSFSWHDLDEVVLVGGSTRMPQVREAIVSAFHKEPVTKNVNVDTIVAAGAAMQAELCIASSLTLSLGGASNGPSRSLGGGTGPANGLTIRGSDIEDITAHSLGMLAYEKKSDDYFNSIILEKNSKVGVAKSKDYSISNDQCEVYVLQGEVKDPSLCSLLYKYTITGLAGGVENKFTVSYSYNQNGMVDVASKDSKGRKLAVKKERVTDDLSIIIKKLKEKNKEVYASNEVIVYIDVSGSMLYGPIEEAKKALKEFINSLNSDFTKVEIVKFASRSEVVCKFNNNVSQLRNMSDSIEADGEVGYGTEGHDIIRRYSADFSPKHKEKALNRIMVILTDGVWAGEEQAIEQADTCKKDGIIIHAVGVGDADHEFLNKLASPGCGQKVNLNQLSRTFVAIANSIATEV